MISKVFDKWQKYPQKVPQKLLRHPGYDLWKFGVIMGLSDQQQIFQIWPSFWINYDGMEPFRLRV